MHLALEFLIVESRDTNMSGIAFMDQGRVGLRHIHEDAYPIGAHDEAFSTVSARVRTVPGWPSRMSRRSFSPAM